MTEEVSPLGHLYEMVRITDEMRENIDEAVEHRLFQLRLHIAELGVELTKPKSHWEEELLPPGSVHKKDDIRLVALHALNTGWTLPRSATEGTKLTLSIPTLPDYVLNERGLFSEDFFVEDEPIEDIRKIMERPPDGVTKEPTARERWLNNRACPACGEGATVGTSGSNIHFYYTSSCPNGHEWVYPYTQAEIDAWSHTWSGSAWKEELGPQGEELSEPTVALNGPQIDSKTRIGPPDGVTSFEERATEIEKATEKYSHEQFLKNVIAHGQPFGGAEGCRNGPEIDSEPSLGHKVPTDPSEVSAIGTEPLRAEKETCGIYTTDCCYDGFSCPYTLDDGRCPRHGKVK